MNQGKLEVVKKEMARVNKDILGLSELKWTGMGKFNSDDHYIYYCGQESCGRNGVALTVKKSPKYNTWVQSQKQQNYLCSFQSKSFSITVIQLYAPTNNAEEAELERFYEDLQNIIELTPKKDSLFIIGDWNAKEGSQEISGVREKFGLGVRNKAGQMLTEFCQENSLVANTLFQQYKRRLYTGHHQMVNTKIRLIIFLAAKDREALSSQQKQDWELTVVQIMNSLLPNSDLS